jgi:ADP-ribose pyrophosphatase
MAGEWERLSTEVVSEYDVFNVRRHVMRSPRTGDAREFHVLDVPRCVKVIAFTTDERVVLVEQFRPAVQRMTLEFPAGVMEAGESAVAAAARELEEETGYRAETVELLTDFDPDPAIQSSVVSVVVARGCTADGLRDQDDGEDVSVRLVAVSEVGDLISGGAIRHAAAISAWSLFERLTGGPVSP